MIRTGFPRGNRHGIAKNMILTYYVNLSWRIPPAITLSSLSRKLTLIKALYESTVKRFINLGDCSEYVAALILVFSFDKVHGGV